jgi:ATPase family AAA domain-containing protein 3A/B
MAFRLLAARRGLYVAGATTAAAACRYRVARLDEGEAAAPPKPPGIYKDADFDPSGIEDVAALAAQRLSKSDLQYKKQESLDKQAEEKKRQAEFQAASRQAAQQARQSQRQETEATRKKRQEEFQRREAYKGQLKEQTDGACAKYDEELKAGEEEDRKAHELRVEQERRKTAELEQALKRDTDAVYLTARASAQSRAERLTQDLRLDQIKERAKVARDTTLEAVRATLTNLGAAKDALLTDPDRALAVVGVLTATAAGVYFSRKFAGVVGDYVDARLRKPALVRETSRGFAVASSAIGSGSIGHVVSRLGAVAKPKAVDPTLLMKGAVFHEKLERSLLRIAAQANGARASKTPFRHCLFVGPPGTGKTLFAKKLAAHARMDYAVMSGGDVAPLGRDAVTDMHKLFDWAEKSPNGLLLLIDEADAFVRKRGADMSEDARNALNAFLFRTGTPSQDVMVVFASNLPELFDSAVHDRVDEIVEFPLPATEERRKILQGDVAEMLAPMARTAFWRPAPEPITLDDGVTDDTVVKAADKCDGFSARELAKLALAWRAAAFATKERVLTPQLVEDTLNLQLGQHAVRQSWLERSIRRKKERDEALRAALPRRTAKSGGV